MEGNGAIDFYSLTHSLTYSLARLPTRLIANSLTHSCPYALTYSRLFDGLRQFHIHWERSGRILGSPRPELRLFAPTRRCVLEEKTPSPTRYGCAPGLCHLVAWTSLKNRVRRPSGRRQPVSRVTRSAILGCVLCGRVKVTPS